MPIASFCNNYKNQSDPQHQYMLQSWMWYGGALASFEEAIKLAAVELPHLTTIANRTNVICHGWVDLMYLPKTLWHPFNELARIFASKGVMGEIAVSTILDILKAEFPHIYHEEISGTPFHCLINR